MNCKAFEIYFIVSFSAGHLLFEFHLVWFILFSSQKFHTNQCPPVNPPSYLLVLALDSIVSFHLIKPTSANQTKQNFSQSCRETLQNNPFSEAASIPLIFTLLYVLTVVWFHPRILFSQKSPKSDRLSTFPAQIMSFRKWVII